MVEYYKPFFDFNYIYSIDKLRFEFFIAYDAFEDFYRLLHYHDLNGNIDFLNQTSRAFSYRHLFRLGSVDYSLILGVGFNDDISFEKDCLKRRCFIEFNPNKILGNIVLEDGIFVSGPTGFVKPYRMSNNPFYDDSLFYQKEYMLDKLYILIDLLKDHIDRKKEIKLKKYDLAIDMAVSRDKVQLFKNHKAYKQFYKSSLDVTEYLGIGQEGRVKVYNKTLESGLDFDVTRFEITSSNVVYTEFIKHFPKVKILNPSSDIKDYVLEMLELISPADRQMILNKMNYRTKTKYVDMIGGDYLNIRESVFDKLMENIEHVKRGFLVWNYDLF